MERAEGPPRRWALESTAPIHKGLEEGALFVLRAEPRAGPGASACSCARGALGAPGAAAGSAESGVRLLCVVQRLPFWRVREADLSGETGAGAPRFVLALEPETAV